VIAASGDGHLIRMIVNADDFGYFDGVSQGIIEAAECGVVTATGVMANGPALPQWIERLTTLSHLSTGVHLNATLGRPLTAEMAERMAFNGGCFPPKGALVSSLLMRRLPVQTLMHEWRAQILYCLRGGLQLDFINSHEHIHALPALYPRVRALADEFGIRHVRAPRPEWGPAITLAGCIRSAALATARLAGPGTVGTEPDLVGVNPSGHMSATYCRWLFPRLMPGKAYELMCHPGRPDALARADSSLNAYHDWEGELTLLMSPDFADMLRTNRIVLASYADLNEAPSSDSLQQ